jgi:hypothetical protein
MGSTLETPRYKTVERIAICLQSTLRRASLTARKPDAVLHRCIPDTEQLAARRALIAAEILSTWSGRRDRVHKMSDYADAGIPHYWLVSFDKIGTVTIERYALAGGAGRYVHVGTSHRDMGPTAIKISAPFPVEILWADLEVAPQVLEPAIHLTAYATPP